MIITRIDCGMGNQMFAYAAGLVTAKRLDTELLLDLEWFKKTQPRKYPRPYMLDCFPKISERPATFKDVYKLFPFQAVINYLYAKKIFWFCGRHFLREVMTALKLLPEGKARIKFLKADPLLLPIPFSRVFTQRDSLYSKNFELIPNDVYMWGAWQSEKFFLNYSQDVREKFSFAPESFKPEYQNKILSCNSVGIHIRLGDRLRHGEADFTAQYIKHALEKISGLVEAPEFFIFSDDIEWCRKNLKKIFDAEYFFIEGNTPAQDMALMTQCRHLIISASTFSWWGAWLNNNPGKIVIAPAQKLWCKNPEDYENFYPAEWIITS